MGRMSGRNRKKLFAMLKQRDGAYCFICGEPGDEKTLVIDHADNDNSNNDPSNLHLVCRAINAAKNPRKSVRRIQSSVGEKERETLIAIDCDQPQSAEFRKNLESEPAFRRWLFIEIWRKREIDYEDALDCGAAVARCSQQTIIRYLKKECSRVRLYKITVKSETKQRLIQFRPFWEMCRRKEEARRLLGQQSRNWRKDSNKDVLVLLKDKKKKVGKTPPANLDESNQTARQTG